MQWQPYVGEHERDRNVPSRPVQFSSALSERKPELQFCGVCNRAESWKSLPPRMVRVYLHIHSRKPFDVRRGLLHICWVHTQTTLFLSCFYLLQVYIEVSFCRWKEVQSFLIRRRRRWWPAMRARAPKCDFSPLNFKFLQFQSLLIICINSHHTTRPHRLSFRPLINASLSRWISTSKHWWCFFIPLHDQIRPTRFVGPILHLFLSAFWQNQIQRSWS